MLEKLGVDKAILFMLLGRGFSFISQPISMYLIAKYFTLSQQGFYYTFANILSVSIFLELSLGLVIMQFASHEFAYLSWRADGSLTGNSEHLSRLISLARKSLKWYGVLSLLFLAVLTPVGLYFFGSNPESAAVDYGLPWICLVVFSALNLILYPFMSIIEGCGKIEAIQQMRLYQALFGALFIWIVILSKGSLLAASVMAGSNFVISVLWIFMTFNGLLRQVLNTDAMIHIEQISWRTEILPMQWRIALSSICGFLVSQLFNPLLFHYQSPTEAGKMGMSMSIANVALVFSMAWISTKFPTYGSLIQKKQYKSLDMVAYRSTLQAFIFNVLLSTLILISVYLIKVYFPYYGNRILSVNSIGALLFSNMLLFFMISMGGYLRAHKVEPLLAMSIITGVLTAVSAWFCAKYFTAEIMTYSIGCINLLIGLPLTAYIFIHKRKEWHEKTEEEQ
jgi:O-antigen/teichoic acid export membrane protein